VLLEKIHETELLSQKFSKRDLLGNSGLDLMEKLGLFKLLQTKVTDRILQMKWSSKIDVSGSIFEPATNYQILKNLNLG
jgi:hypothetical protein